MCLYYFYFRSNFLREISDIIYHVFVVSGCPELFVLGHKSLYMRNTKVKQDHINSSWRNKEILWKKSSVQWPLTFDCFVDHETPQDEVQYVTSDAAWYPKRLKSSMTPPWEPPNSQIIPLSQWSHYFCQLRGLYSSYSQRFPGILWNYIVR